MLTGALYDALTHATATRARSTSFVMAVKQEQDTRVSNFWRDFAKTRIENLEFNSLQKKR